MTDDVYRDAVDLARQLHAEHWPENTGWSPLEDTRGVLTQISNMCTLMRDQKAEIERLKAALREIANMANRLDDCLSDATHVARKALEGSDVQET